MLTIDVVFPEVFHNFLKSNPYYHLESLTLTNVTGNGILIFDDDSKKKRLLSYYDPSDMVLVSTSLGIHIDIKKELYLVLNGELNKEAQIKAPDEDRHPIFVNFSEELREGLAKENLKLVRLQLYHAEKMSAILEKPDGSRVLAIDKIQIRVANGGPSLEGPCAVS